MSGPSDSIMAVAAKIHERALQLTSERATRDMAKAELDETNLVLAEETDRYHQARRKLLSSVRRRNGVELEVYRIQDQQKEHMHTAERLEKETAKLNAMADATERQWTDMIERTIAPHFVKRRVFENALEGRIVAQQVVEERRKRKLAFLLEEASQYADECAHVRDETKQVRAETKRVKQNAARQDEELSGLSMQIKATIAKVSRTRSLSLLPSRSWVVVLSSSSPMVPTAFASLSSVG